MNALFVIVIAIVLTGLTIVVARASSRTHQEELSTHADSAADAGALTSESVQDRPADAEAEPMGVRDPGEPSVRRED